MLRRNLLRVAALGAVAVLSATSFTPAAAIVPTSTSAVNTNQAGLALRGFDPVAYFAIGRPTAGKARFSHVHEGVTYRFSTAANQRSFQANPTAYIPQFGGFCALGVVLDKKLDGDPMIWRVVDGKLYLNVNRAVQTTWSQDVPGNVMKAIEKWPLIQGRTPASLG